MLDLFPSSSRHLRWVDDANHLRLAVVTLGAVEPDWCRGIRDVDHEGSRRGVGSVGGGNIARPDTILHRLAGGVES